MTHPSSAHNVPRTVSMSNPARVASVVPFLYSSPVLFQLPALAGHEAELSAFRRCCEEKLSFSEFRRSNLCFLPEREGWENAIASCNARVCRETALCRSYTRFASVCVPAT